MSQKAALLAAVRDELKGRVAAAGNRVYVVVQDAQGNQLLPREAATPFLTVADGGADLTPYAGKVADGIYQIMIRAYVQDLRDVETPVLGHEPSGSQGAAQLQDQVLGILKYNLLAARIAGVDQALPASMPRVDFVADEEWFAVVGDVVMRYEIVEP